MPNVMLKLLDDEFLIAHDARRGRRSIQCRTLLAFGLHTDTMCLSVACRLSVLLLLQADRQRCDPSEHVTFRALRRPDNVSNGGVCPQRMYSRCAHLTRRRRSVLHETGDRSAQSYRPPMGRPLGFSAVEGTAVIRRRGRVRLFMTQTCRRQVTAGDLRP